MSKAIAASVLILLAAVSCEQAAAQDQRPEIVIASDFPTSAFRTPLAMEQAIGFAIKHQTSIKSFRLRYWPLDDSLGAEQSQLRGRENARRIVADSSVLGVIGPFSSFVGQVQIPVDNEAHLAMVSPTTTNSCLTVAQRVCLTTAASLRPTQPNNFFRIAPRDPLQGKAMAAFAATKVGLTKVAAFNEFGAEGTLYLKEFADEFHKRGGTVVYQQDPLNDQTVDFSEFLSQAKAHGAEAVYAIADEDHRACRAAVQMSVIMPGAKFLGVDGISLEADCIKEFGDSPAAVWATYPAVDPRTSTDQVVKQQVEAFDQAFPGAANMYPYTFAAYDCARILIEAIRIAIAASEGGVPRRDQVVRALAANNFVGVTGAYSFDQNGDAQHPMMSMYTVKGGAWVNVPLDPSWDS